MVLDRTLIGDTTLRDVVGLQIVPAESYEPRHSRDGLLPFRFLNPSRLLQAVHPYYQLMAEYSATPRDPDNGYAMHGLILESAP